MRRQLTVTIYVCISIYNIDVRRCVCMRVSMCVCESVCVCQSVRFRLHSERFYHLSYHIALLLILSSKFFKLGMEKIQAIIEKNFTKYI